MRRLILCTIARNLDLVFASYPHTMKVLQMPRPLASFCLQWHEIAYVGPSDELL